MILSANEGYECEIEHTIIIPPKTSEILITTKHLPSRGYIMQTKFH